MASYTMKKVVLLLTFTLASLQAYLQADTTDASGSELSSNSDLSPGTRSIDDLEANIFERGDEKMPYRFFIPKNQVWAYKYPLVVFLHGLGDGGDDNKNQLKHPAPLIFIQDKKQKEYPCYFLAPETGKSRSWLSGNLDRPSGSLSLAVHLIDSLCEKYPSIDQKRIYLTGLSNGGLGVLDALQWYPSKFAAIVPISAIVPLNNLTDKTVRPIWLFYGDEDEGVDKALPVMEKNLSRLGVQLRKTAYHSGHNVWDQAYAEKELIPWLFNQQLP